MPKQGPLLSDGVRIYFVSGSMNHRSISQISVNGGEASTLVSALQSPRLMDISSNGSELLAASFGPDPGASMGGKAGLNESALWGISLPSGNVQRIGDLFADAAAFAPDGQKIAIGWNHALYVVNSDGTDQKEIAPLSGTVSSIRWSPNGKRLRLSIMDPKTLRSSLWELLKDGASLHEILGGWNPAPAECCGRWSPDGRWYVFQSTRDGKTDIWALPESSGLINRKPREPIQLTAGQINSLAPELSPDGRKLYMIGQLVPRWTYGRLQLLPRFRSAGRSGHLLV